MKVEKENIFNIIIVITCSPQPDVFYIAPKYADDITFVTTSKEMINKIKETIPPQLKKYNRMVNETKTEQYQACGAACL